MVAITGIGVEETTAAAGFGCWLLPLPPRRGNVVDMTPNIVVDVLVWSVDGVDDATDVFGTAMEDTAYDRTGMFGVVEDRTKEKTGTNE
jgi:hypothetical protein